MDVPSCSRDKHFPDEPSAPYAMGNLSIGYAQRRVTLVGEPVELRPRSAGC